ncbi:hypothetical protein HYW41_01510 [Candidatus Daviesbacteria bacterium]|nr:hypothetical protein [Candidatus Daviesbacteria bacterium]
MKTNNLPLVEFNPKLPKLSKNEQAVLKLLIEAGRLTVPIFLAQEKQLEKDGNFYPKGVSKKEVDEAAKKNPEILSPFTVVEKIDGQLQAIPYHIKYAKALKPIADKLYEASKLTENKEFARFLKLKANALVEGSYEEPVAAWMKMKTYILDITIGPFEHHDDRLFYAKASYQCWVGVVDLEKTKQLNYYKYIVLSARRKALFPDERFENYREVKAKVDSVILFSGHMARTKFVGVNIPMNLDWVEKYGSEVTLFNEVNDARVKEQILPTFNKIFTPAFRKGFSEEDLRKGNMNYVALHEFAHNDLYYKNAAKNLADLLSPVYELSASVLGMRMAGSLLLKDIITNKQLESMVVAFICRSFYLIERGQKSKTWANYATGGIIFINFMFNREAIKRKNRLIIVNFMKIFLALQDLSYALEFLLSSGTRENADAFIKKYVRLSYLS